MRPDEHLLIADEPAALCQEHGGAASRRGTTALDGTHGSGTGCQNYSWRMVAKQFADILAEVVAKSSAKTAESRAHESSSAWPLPAATRRSGNQSGGHPALSAKSVESRVQSSILRGIASRKRMRFTIRETRIETAGLLFRLRYDVLHLHVGGMLSRRVLRLGLVCSLVPGKKTVFTFHSGGYPSLPEAKALTPAISGGPGFAAFRPRDRREPADRGFLSPIGCVSGPHTIDRALRFFGRRGSHRRFARTTARVLSKPSAGTDFGWATGTGIRLWDRRST